MLQAERADLSMTESDPLVGRTLGDRWSLRYRLGAGGMGAVYLAHDAAGGPAAAVKVVKRELADDAEARARFSREADALRRLDHPCIVRFFDTGESGDLRWIAMELLEGRTLKSRLAARGALPWRESIPILRDVVRALQAAHGAGLIHRDLKPENIFLIDALRGGDAPIVKLLDFGVARHLQLPAGQTMTATGAVIGTPGFVAPEVVLKGPSNDPRSDFYGLGATWFEMLTGEKPFSAETPFALAMLHVSQQAPLPRTVRPQLTLPPRAEALLMSLLAKTPDARPPNSDVLLAELDAIVTAPDGPAATSDVHSSLHNRFLPIGGDDTPMTRSGARPPANLLPNEATATAGFTALHVAHQRVARSKRMAAAVGCVIVALTVGAVIAARLAVSGDTRAGLPTSEAQPMPPLEMDQAPPALPTAPGPAIPPRAVEPAPSQPGPQSDIERPRSPRPERAHKPRLLPLEQGALQQ